MAVAFLRVGGWILGLHLWCFDMYLALLFDLTFYDQNDTEDRLSSYRIIRDKDI